MLEPPVMVAVNERSTLFQALSATSGVSSEITRAISCGHISIAADKTISRYLVELSLVSTHVSQQTQLPLINENQFLFWSKPAPDLNQQYRDLCLRESERMSEIISMRKWLRNWM